MGIEERQTEESWNLGVITPKLKIHSAVIIVIQSGKRFYFYPIGSWIYFTLFISLVRIGN